jgi:cytoskeletal protein CcmA (bactofilin family)
MSVTVNVNGVAISYPQTGDSEWGDEATDFAIQTGSALGKLGLSTGTSVDIPSTLDVTGATKLDSTLEVDGATQLDGSLTVAGHVTLNGNTNIGNETSDTTAVTGILNVDSGTLYVNPTDNRVGVNTATPTVALDVVGNATISGTLIAGTFAPTDLTVDTNLIKTNSTDNRVGINTTSPTVALDVTGAGLFSSDLTTGGILTASNSTNVTTAPPVTFTGDTDTGIGHSAADTLDFVTGGQPRFRIESTGQIKAVYESTLGTDYNTQLDNGYLCRAWVNFNGTSSNLTGTYTRSGNTITVSITSHGLSTGQTVYLDFTSGGATDGIYVVTVINANSYTVIDTASGTITTSNVTQFRYIRASGNVSSITRPHPKTIKTNNEKASNTS